VAGEQKQGPGSPVDAGNSRSPTSPLVSIGLDPRSFVHRRSSLILADLPVALEVAMTNEPSRSGTANANHEPTGAASPQRTLQKIGIKTSPTLFTEPDPASLLDAFGF